MRSLWQALLCTVVALGTALPLPASAQMEPAPPPGAAPPAKKLEVSAYGGWGLTSDVNGGGATLELGDATTWGASLGLRVPHGSMVELRWVYTNTTAQFHGFGNSNEFQVPTNYFLLGGEKGFRRQRMEPFFNGSLGTVVYAPESFQVAGARFSPGTTWRMAFAIGGGVKIFATEKLALRLGAEILGPIFFSGGSFYVGTGGASVGVSGGIPTVTGNFTVGITFRP